MILFWSDHAWNMHLCDTLQLTCGVPGPVFAEEGLDVGRPGLLSAFPPPGPPPSCPGIFCCIIPIPWWYVGIIIWKEFHVGYWSPEDQDWLVQAPHHPHHLVQIVEDHVSGRGWFVASVHAEAGGSRRGLQGAAQGVPEGQGPECQVHFLHCILPHVTPCGGWGKERFLPALYQRIPVRSIEPLN